MQRTRPIWTVYTAALVVVIAVMAWVTTIAQRLDALQRQSQAEAEENRRVEAWEEKIRLALWRMDTHAAPIVGRETARPCYTYIAAAEASTPYNAMFNDGWMSYSNAPPMMLSPLAGVDDPYVLLHFTISPEGRLSSPEHPFSNPSQSPEARELWFTLARSLDRRALLDRLDGSPTIENRFVDRSFEEYAALSRPEEPQIAAPNASPASSQGKVVMNAKGGKGNYEYEKRSQLVQHNFAATNNELQNLIANSANPPTAQQTAQQAVQQQAPLNSSPQYGQASYQQPSYGQATSHQWAEPRVAQTTLQAQQPPLTPYPPQSAPYAVQQRLSQPAVMPQQSFTPQHDQQQETQQIQTLQTFRPPAGVTTSVMVPIWLGGHPVLVRKVDASGQAFLQGCVLDWDTLRGELSEVCNELLPDAELAPILKGEPSQQDYAMATLPIRLIPGDPPPAPFRKSLEPPFSPLMLSLVIAWICVLAAAGAIGVLTLGLIRLSRRRTAFVTAVTHELRTPLTTFQMYAEMLAEGMIRDDTQRQTYLDTLRTEAGRLIHMVENVLAYARMNRGRGLNNIETLTLADLLDRVLPSLERRAARDEMVLEVDCETDVEPQYLRVSVSAIEQILFNLVDNACKYAGDCDDRRIQLRVGHSPRASDGLLLTVRDFGPGISDKLQANLFRAFSKSAQEAAETKPGVGLGLALSRDFARSMGGDLTLCADVAPGSCFELRLPRGGHDQFREKITRGG